MHRRYQHTNIPTEIVRTIVVIAETGSFSKAGERLGLTQPAISAQMRRLQTLVGGSIFEKTATGVSFSPKGQLILAHARRLLQANDQILQIGGAPQDAAPIRIGLLPMLATAFFSALQPSEQDIACVTFTCGHSRELAKALADGYLDIASFLSAPQEGAAAALEWTEEFVWAQHRDFALCPGMPLPLIAWPDTWHAELMISALEKAHLAYRFVVSTADDGARIAAAVAGMGLIILPARQLAEPLVAAKAYDLPPVPAQRMGIYCRHGLDQTRIAPILGKLKILAAVEKKKSRKAGLVNDRPPERALGADEAPPSCGKTSVALSGVR